MGGFFSVLWSEIKGVFTTLFWKTDVNKFGWMQYLMAAPFGPFGQIMLRAIYANGSLEKWWWLIIGCIPAAPIYELFPGNLLANLLIKWGFIPDGPGPPIFDYWMLIPVAVKIFLAILPFIVDIEIDLVFFLLSFIFMATAAFIPSLIKAAKNCPCLTYENIIKAGRDAVVAVGTAYFMFILFDMVVATPGIPIADDALWLVMFAFTYSLTAMLNQNFMDKYCKEPNSNTTEVYATLITAGVGVLLYLAMNVM
jgi:hypothetical protein